MNTTITTPLGITHCLESLSEDINRAHHKAEQALNAGLAHAIRAGELLAEAKSQCKHGEWLGWLEDHFDGSVRNAQCYMRVAARREEIESKSQGLAHLGFEEALKLTAEPKDTLSESERAEFNILDRYVADNLPQAEAELDVYEQVLAGIPRLSPDEVLLGVDEDTQRLIHFEPCVGHPGYYHLLVITRGESIESPEDWFADYDRRGIKYTREFLALSLVSTHQAYPSELIPMPADGRLMIPGFNPNGGEAC